MSRVVRAAAVLRVLAALLGIGAVVGLAPTTSAAVPGPGATGAEASAEVVLVGVPGLSWTDITPRDTPRLHALAREGAIASLTVRSVRSRACAVDGWLTLSAGRRAADQPGPCREPAEVGADGAVPRWQDFVAAARVDSYDAVPGALGQALTDAGVCVEALGPGAAIAAADRRGRVTAFSPQPPGAQTCPVTLLDGGTLPESSPDRARALAALDDLVVDLGRRSGASAVIVVAGVGDGASPIRPRAVLAAGMGRGLLTSPSTRQPGLVQLQDLTATLLDLSGVQGVSATGRAVALAQGSPEAAERVAARQGFEVRAGTLRSVSPQVTGWLAAAFAAWSVLVGLVLWRGGPVPRALRVVGVAIAGVPVGTFLANLVPWWSTGSPALTFLAVLAVVLATLTWAAVQAGRRARMGALLTVSVVTLLVLGGDVLSGSGLQLASVFGQNPVVGGRFYGIGNTSYALYGVAVMAVVGCLASSRRWLRRHTLGLPALVLLLATALDGHPALGADFGGPPGLLLGGLVVLAMASRVRLGAARVVAALLAVTALAVAVAVLDRLRPAPSRTHLGEFVQTVLDGGAGDVVGRKVAQNLTNLGSPPLLAITLGALVLGVLVWRSGRGPTGVGAVVLRGSAVLAVVGFAVNDSGLVVPAFAALMLLPLLVADDLLGLRGATEAGTGVSAPQTRPARPARPGPHRHPWDG